MVSSRQVGVLGDFVKSAWMKFGALQIGILVVTSDLVWRVTDDGWPKWIFLPKNV
jgi:hypothetical protein